MALTKARTSIWSSQTLTAGAGSTTSSGQDLSDSYATRVNFKLTNGATGPTVAAQVQIEVSNDDSTYVEFGGPYVGNTSNNGVESWSVDLPIDTKYFRLVAGSNTGQDVTAFADYVEVTSIT